MRCCSRPGGGTGGCSPAPAPTATPADYFFFALLAAVYTSFPKHCRPSCADDGSPLYVAGFSFVDDEAVETKRTVAVLLEKVTVVDLYGKA